MNYMKQVAELLGVEFGEKFNIKGRGDRKYYLNTTGLREIGLLATGEKVDQKDFNNLLQEIILNSDKIIKLPWKPIKDEMYHFIDPQGGIFPGRWHSDFCDIALYAFGNCFRTKTEAEKHKDEVLAKMKEVMKG